jgi:hypothetical protein
LRHCTFGIFACSMSFAHCSVDQSTFRVAPSFETAAAQPPQDEATRVQQFTCQSRSETAWFKEYERSSSSCRGVQGGAT